MSDKLIVEWNTLSIIERQIEFYRECGEHSEMDDEELFDLAAKDAFLFDDESQYLHSELTDWIAEHNPDGDWHVEVDNFGWRNMSGHKTFAAETGKALLSAVLPDTDCQFKVYEYKNTGGLKIQNWHHDSPWGNEIYRIWPASRCEWCGDIVPFDVDGIYCCEDCKLDAEEET